MIVSISEAELILISLELNVSESLEDLLKELESAYA